MNKIEQGIKDAHDELAAHKAENVSTWGFNYLKTSQKSSLVEAINELLQMSVMGRISWRPPSLTRQNGLQSGNIATFDELDNEFDLFLLKIML